MVSQLVKFGCVILIGIRYHFYFDPHREQMYQLCQMAFAMVVELGIDKHARQTEVSITSFNPTLLPIMRHGKPAASELEAMRAFLGCYYLTSS